MTPRATIYSLLLALFCLCLASCSSDDLTVAANGEGALRLTLADISTQTRSTPDELGAPTPGDFTLHITNNVGRAVYEGTFTDEEFILPTGTYTVSATYGEDAMLAVDNPYYVATETAEVEAGKTTDIALRATVGNALVSVVFGIDDAERQRFDRFYSDYALYVGVGSYSIPITKAEPTKSVYVRDGSAVTLRFWGKLKLENDREVQATLEAPNLPATLSAADHAIITLTLPDPESALNVAIAKVELTELTLDETIPLSWLPVAMAVPMHQYDENGTLLGTNILITESYPGMKWRAVITNAAGTTVRAIEGTGALQSYYYNNTEWPYLPQGQYTATYFLIDDTGKATQTSSRQFTVDAPAIQVTTGGFTSYDKYLSGDIEGANACDRLTVYEPSMSVNVANDLLRNANYPYTFTYDYNGTKGPATAGSNTYTPGNLTGQPVRQAPYVLTATATFDGVTATAQKQFQITGLPYSLNLKDHGEWDASGGVDWFDNDVRLGHLSTGGQYIRTGIAISLPPSTRFCADYNVNVHTLTVGTTFSIDVGTNKILSITEAGTPFNDKDHLHSGTTSTFSDDSQWTTSIQCNNSYGAGQTCSHIYSLTLKYAKP